MREHGYLPEEVNRQFIPRPESEAKVVDNLKLKEDLERIQTEPQLDEEAVRELLNNVSREYGNNIKKEGTELSWEDMSKEKQSHFRELIQRIVLRLETELGDSGNFRHRELTAKLMEKEELKFVTLFKKYCPRKIATQLEDFKLNQGASAAYFPARERIVLVDNKRSDRGVLNQLATEGYSEEADNLHHETIHHFQFQHDSLKSRILRIVAKNLLFFSALSSIELAIPGFMFPPGVKVLATGAYSFKSSKEAKKISTILNEAQAFIGSERYSPEKNRHILKGKDTDYLETMQNYGMKNDDVEKISSAVNSIRKLYALGLTDETIALLEAKEQWDPKQKTFTGLNNAVETLRKTGGYSDEQLDQLVEADDLRREIFIEKVKRITQAELQKDLQELTQPSQA